MPFVFEYAEVEQGDEDRDLPSPKLPEFRYFQPHDFGGERQPVRFTVDAIERAPPASPPRRFLDRLLGRAPAIPAPARPPVDHSKQLCAIIVPALRQQGVRKAIICYDGGSDEGFAWFERFECADGQKPSLKALTEKLKSAGVQNQLNAAGFTPTAKPYPPYGNLREILDYQLPTEWASLLLGHGFGTGEYSMYGACTVDLETCTITDDPKAEAIVRNIDISWAT